MKSHTVIFLGMALALSFSCSSGKKSELHDNSIPFELLPSLNALKTQVLYLLSPHQNGLQLPMPLLLTIQFITYGANVIRITSGISGTVTHHWISLKN
jgi:hypothetical protein